MNIKGTTLVQWVVGIAAFVFTLGTTWSYTNSTIDSLEKRVYQSEREIKQLRSATSDIKIVWNKINLLEERQEAIINKINKTDIYIASIQTDLKHIKALLLRMEERLHKQYTKNSKGINR